MKAIKVLSTITLAVSLIFSGANLFAHGSGSGSGDSMGDFMVTRHFTGAWAQVDQESQGLNLEVIDQWDHARRSVAYWYTYGADRKTAWYLGIGDLVDDHIVYELYDSTDVGFMQDDEPGDDSVQSIGTMTIVFDNCNSGTVTFETSHAEVGSGSFNIVRVSEIMNTHCSGGISDDMHADAMFGEQRMELTSAREGIAANGHARYEDYPGHMEFEIDVEGLPDGDYHLYIGMQDRGVFSVIGGRGSMEFTSPGEIGNMMMTFDPRGMLIEIHDDQGVVLSTFENRFAPDEHVHHGDGGEDDHHFDCESGQGMGHGMGSGMGDCVNAGEFIEIEVDLTNTTVLPEAKGEAEWKMNTNRVEFSVEIEDVPVGSYALKVGGIEEGIIETYEMHDGDVYGRITFRDPETTGRKHLDFEPRGQKLEVFQGDNVILEASFPSE
jgi:hypothetical protein